MYLTPEAAQLLLSGQSIKGIPVILNMPWKSPQKNCWTRVRSASFSKGTWRMLSDYIREPEQEQPPFEQGVDHVLKILKTS